MSMRVAVVGAGIAGLSAARELAVGGADVVLLEAGPRCGGKLDSVILDGVRLDCGAESVLARRPEAVALMADLGLGAQVVHPTSAKAQVYLGGEVRSLPPQAMGVPVDLDSLEGFLSQQGLDRARQEPSLPAPPLAGDVGIGAYVDARFGLEVTDRLLEPLLGGVYAGQARALSFEAVSPRLFELARAGGSLLEHARAMTPTQASGPVFAGLVGGIGRLVDVLLADLAVRGVQVRTGVTVRAVDRRRGGGFRLTTGPVPDPQALEVDAVVLATPAAATSRLLGPFLPGVAAEVAAIPYASMAVVTLVVRHASLAGSGLLVPPGQLPTIKALTHSSAKWQWVADHASAAWGEDVSVVRASVGRLGEAELLQVDDATLLARTLAEARTLPGWDRAELVTSQVRRWGGALPQYLVGHRAVVARLRAAVAGVPGLEVCGAALDGLGIAATIGTATGAARNILTAGGDTPSPERPNAECPESECPDSERQYDERNAR
ncbi:MAG: protoporphyrinogen/coproporphyrinogen oxidase [Propionibacteriaceae bacterium]|nr:protoporphyrinogen/coproporphyrinogen oxidase [Propionibacteriaceae bacterium]